MDELVDAHFRADAAGDLQAIADGFTADAEHDVAGRPGPSLRGGQQINNSSPPDHTATRPPRRSRSSALRSGEPPCGRLQARDCRDVLREVIDDRVRQRRARLRHGSRIVGGCRSGNPWLLVGATVDGDLERAL
jgi:hypothetical protein